MRALNCQTIAILTSLKGSDVLIIIIILMCYNNIIYIYIYIYITDYSDSKFPSEGYKRWSS